MSCEYCGQSVGKRDTECKSCGARIRAGAENEPVRGGGNYGEGRDDPGGGDDGDYDENHDDDDDYDDEYDDDYDEYPQRQSQNGPPLKKRWVALLLCFFLGGLGVHRFYLGHYRQGFIIAGIAIGGFVTGLFFLEFFVLAWVISDLVRIAVRHLKDAYGRDTV